MAPPAGAAALCCAAGTGGTAVTPKGIGRAALLAGQEVKRAQPWRGPWHRGAAAAGCRAALTGTQRVGRDGQIYPSIRCPRKVKFPLQTWLCVKCEKQRIKPASGRMVTTAAVALFDKTLCLILESNNGERQERK